MKDAGPFILFLLFVITQLDVFLGYYIPSFHFNSIIIFGEVVIAVFVFLLEEALEGDTITIQLKKGDEK